MSQAVEGTHTTAVDDAGRHDRHQTQVRTDPRAPHGVMSRRIHSSLAPTVLLMAVSLIIIAAPAYVLLGEKGIAVSPSLWQLALDLCRVATGVLGLLTIASVVTGRRSESSGDGTFGSVAFGVVLIAAAVAAFGLVIVITGIGGLILLYVGGALGLDAFRSSVPEPGLTPERGEGIEPFRDPAALTGAGR